MKKFVKVIFAFISVAVKTFVFITVVVATVVADDISSRSACDAPLVQRDERNS